MKKVAVLVVLIAVVVGATPFLGGKKAKNQLDALVTQLDSNPSYTAYWVNYQQGWLKSKGQLELGLDLGSALASDAISLVVDIEVAHGPILFSRGGLGWYAGRVDLNSDADGWLHDKLKIKGDGSFWQLDFLTNLSGETSFSDRTLEFELQLDDGLVFVEPYSGEGKFYVDGRMEYAALLPLVSLSSEDGKVDTNDLSVGLTADFSEGYNRNFPPSNGHLSIASIIGQVDDESINIQDLKMASVMEYNAEKTMTQSSVTFNMASFEGLGEKVEGAVMEFSADRISVVFLEKYIEMSQGLDPSNPSAASMLGFQMLGVAMSDLIPNGPVISVDQLKFTTSDGAFDLNAKVSVSEDAAKVANPMELITHVKASSELVISQKLAEKFAMKSARDQVEAQAAQMDVPPSQEEIDQMVKDQVDMQLSMLVIQGLVALKDGNYETVFSFENGQAQINGKPMPLPF